MTTRIGIIGIGGFAAHYHLPHLLARDNVSIAGICDTDATRLKKVDPRLTDIPSFTDYRPLLDLGLDALLISSQISTISSSAKQRLNTTYTCSSTSH
jgi:predicted dehydrogenase